LASTDLSTARQKYQRAFAAELLCPVDAVVNFLDGDLSESALDEAAEYFEVGEITVRSLLSNNGYLPSAEPRIPYPLAA
jgi:Zn-dependent peptidase ImmA (M78 family)